MNELIPPFDWQQVVVEPWAESFGLYLWVVLMGFLVTTACGLVGTYLILRRMALVGDAISHSVLPGLVVAFMAANWVTGDSASGSHDLRAPGIMFLGALAAGLLTTVLIELIHKKSRVKQDAAIGITFSSLFAIGVVLISLFADKVDLDADCVLYGEITFVPLEPPLEAAQLPFLNQLGFIRDSTLTLGPPSVFRMLVVTLLTIGLIVVFFKELLVSSFDPGLAASQGINATLVHYSLMCWLSVVVVSAFEAVGAILVIAMLILPGAFGSLLSEKLSVIQVLSVIHAALSSVLGLHLALWLNCSSAGAMVVMAAFLFLLAWVFSPRQGLLRRWLIRLVSDKEEGELPAATQPFRPEETK